MPRIMPEDRYFSMPSMELGAEVRMKCALNCWPWVRSLTQSPAAVIHSPAEIVAAWPTMVTRSRCPRAFIRSTQKPLSALWNVTRSTVPASTSRSGRVEDGGGAIGWIMAVRVGCGERREQVRRQGLAAGVVQKVLFPGYTGNRQSRASPHFSYRPVD